MSSSGRGRCRGGPFHFQPPSLGENPRHTLAGIGAASGAVLGTGAGVAVTASGPLVQKAAADNEPADEKRKARYQANSPDVQAFYRVNRYPTK